MRRSFDSSASRELGIDLIVNNPFVIQLKRWPSIHIFWRFSWCWRWKRPQRLKVTISRSRRTSDSVLNVLLWFIVAERGCCGGNDNISLYLSCVSLSNCIIAFNMNGLKSVYLLWFYVQLSLLAFKLHLMFIV